MQNSEIQISNRTKIENFLALQKLEMCIEVFDTPKVRDCDRMLVFDVVSLSLTKAKNDLGFSMDDDAWAHLLANASDDIIKVEPNIRIGEIPIAINKGILGDYGDFYGLSVVTVLKFIRSHYNSLKRAEIAKQIKPKEEEKEPPTLEEQKVIAKQHVVDEFERFKISKTIPLSGVYLYRFLSEHFGLVSYSNELKYQMYYEGAKSIVKGLKDEILKMPNTRLSNSKKILEIENFFAIEDNPTKCGIAIHKGLKDEILKIQIRNESERIALKRYFNDLIEMGSEIKDLLDE